MIYDITPTISSSLNVWPGDTPFSHDILLSTINGDNITLSKISTTLHLGAHTDAPNHYGLTKSGIDRVKLENYIGECLVIDVTNVDKSRITPSDLHTHEFAERVLLKTNSFPDPNNWNDNFIACSAELIDFLHDHHVKLIGIDTPSIDPQNDKFLESHQRVHAHDMSILEGIVLSEVPEGRYELIALPLKLKDADASPVRAILRTL